MHADGTLSALSPPVVRRGRPHQGAIAGRGGCQHEAGKAVVDPAAANWRRHDGHLQEADQRPHHGDPSIPRRRVRPASPTAVVPLRFFAVWSCWLVPWWPRSSQPAISTRTGSRRTPASSWGHLTDDHHLRQRHHRWRRSWRCSGRWPGSRRIVVAIRDFLAVRVARTRHPAACPDHLHLPRAAPGLGDRHTATSRAASSPSASTTART